MFWAPYWKADSDSASTGGRPRSTRIGVVLGAGAARGWAHIGALQELNAFGIRPEIVVGSSIGTLVGGCYAAGKLDMLESFARSLTRRRMLGLIDFSFAGAGLLGAERVIAFNISSDSAGRGTAIQEPFGRMEPPPTLVEPANDSSGVIARWWRGAARPAADPDAAPPGLMTVMVNAFDILQDRIMRSRLAGDPPDALIQLKVGKIGMFEFNRADELIAIGRDAVRKAAAEIADHIEAPRIESAGE